MACLDGLRCLSMAWVILGHTLVFPAIEPIGGLQYSERALGTASLRTLPTHPPVPPPARLPTAPVRHPGAGPDLPSHKPFAPSGCAVSELLPVPLPPGSSDVSIPPNGGVLAEMAYQILPGAFFAVDTFFWMGGLLTALALLKQMRRMRAGWFRQYPVFVIRRWVRLTPLVLVAILWTIGVNDALGDGPFWALQGDSAECAKSWWVEILYVQNFMWLARPEYSQCLPHLWYLSNDMQFYLCAPLLVFPFVVYKAAGAPRSHAPATTWACMPAPTAISH